MATFSLYSTEGGTHISAVDIFVYEFQAGCKDSTNHCRYTMDDANTPTVTDIEPPTITTNPTTLRIRGHGFDNTGVTVTVGNDDCSVAEARPSEVSLLI